MGTGKTDNVKLAWIETGIASLPGDLAEIGVDYGATFCRLVAMAERRGCQAHAFDSFVGMDEPGPNDNAAVYPKGKFDQGGVEKFRKRMDSLCVPRDFYSLWSGFVSSCFHGAEDLKFAFVYLDLDVYGPSKQALEFLWPRLHVGGILMVDDYNRDVPGRVTQAIDEWMEVTSDAVYGGCLNDQLIVTKMACSRQPV